MRIFASETTLLVVQYPPSFAGAGTIGYTLRNANGSTTPSPAQARTTTGVRDLGNGIFNVDWVAPAVPWNGMVLWDTGSGANPLTEEIEVVKSPVFGDDARLNHLDANVSDTLRDDDGRLAALDAAISSRVSAADPRLAHLDADVSSRADNTVIDEVIALLGRNMGMRDTVYDPSNNLLAYSLFLYDTDAHAATNDGVTGVLHKYTVTSTYDLVGNTLTQVTKKVS
jgi:hypothetical protein